MSIPRKHIPEMQLPEQLKPHLATFSTFFPDGVEYERETRSIKIVAEQTFEFRVAMSHLKLLAAVDDITANLDLVIEDMLYLGRCPPASAIEGRRRYVLLTKLFFYELLRIRDAFPRFLKSIEVDGVMSRVERDDCRKMFEKELDGLYLIRNVYLHGHSIPENDNEAELSLLSSLEQAGYERKLKPLNGGVEVCYPQILTELCEKRHKTLADSAFEVVQLMQNIVMVSVVWIAHHKFKSADT